MRVVAHTCSNTEIVCALGCGDRLVGVDSDSDHPAEAVAALPRLGRDLDLDVGRVAALKPDLVLTSLTVPGHQAVVDGLRQAGLPILVIDPVGLAGVYDSIMVIAEALGVTARGRSLVAGMQAAMPQVAAPAPPPIHVEWWPKPVIAPARDSWVTDLIDLAGGINPWANRSGQSAEVSDADADAAAPAAVVMSWCGVKEENYRHEVVRRRAGWAGVPAVCNHRIYAVTEAYLGRPGPRLVEGYAALRTIIEACRKGDVLG